MFPDPHDEADSGDSDGCEATSDHAENSLLAASRVLSAGSGQRLSRAEVLEARQRERDSKVCDELQHFLKLAEAAQDTDVRASAFSVHGVSMSV